MFKYSIFAAFERGLRNILNFVAFLLISSSLGPEYLGEIGFWWTVGFLASALITFGLPDFIQKVIDDDDEENKRYLLSSLLITLGLSILYFSLFSITISYLDGEMDLLLITVSQACVFFNFFKVLERFIYAQKTRINLLYCNLMVGIFLFVIKVLMITVFNFKDVFYVLYTFEGLVYLMAYLFLIRNLLSWDCSYFSVTNIVYTLRSSFGLFLIAAITILYGKIDVIMLRYYVNDFQLGQYAFALRLVEGIYFIPLVIINTLMPKFKEYRKIYDKGECMFLLPALVGSFTLLLIFNFCIFIMFYSSFLPEYKESEVIIKILSFNILFITIGHYLSKVALLREQIIIVTTASVFGVFLNCMANLYFIPKFGIVGASYTSLIAMFTSSFLGYLVFAKGRRILSDVMNASFRRDYLAKMIR